MTQGDVIGYVGKSGLATGPHLHYEYRVSGVHRNPRTVALPPADPIPAERQAEFQAETQPLWRQLDGYARGFANVRTETRLEPLAVELEGLN